MLRSGALRSTDSELVQACIKGLTSLFALHNNRLAVRADARIQSKERQAMKEINDIMPDGGYFTTSHYSFSPPLPTSTSSLSSSYFSFYFHFTGTTSHLLILLCSIPPNNNLDELFYVVFDSSHVLAWTLSHFDQFFYSYPRSIVDIVPGVPKDNTGSTVGSSSKDQKSPVIMTVMPLSETNIR